jgi:cytochrome b subunit of formate dehydrogenase
MDELSIIFSSQPATTVFYIGSIAIMLLYVTGVILQQRWSRAFGPLPQTVPAPA